MVTAVLLSLLKPMLGAVGLLLVAAGLGLVVALAVGMLRMNAATLSRVDGAHPAAVEARERARRLGLAGGLAVAPLLLLASVEFATPDEGLTRTLLAGARPNPIVEPVAESPEPSMDPAPWASADFVLVGPDEAAVAIRHEPSASRFHILGRESGPRGVEAQRIAWDRGVQLIDEDPAPELAKRLSALSEDGVVAGRLESDLRQLWRVHQYVPRELPLAEFHDLRRRGERRVGFVDERQPDELSFIPLNPRRLGQSDGSAAVEFAAETIRKQDVRPASHRYNFGEDQLRETSDFLDYSVYQVLRGLSKEPNQARYVRVAVAPVRYESEKLLDLKKRAEGLRREYLEEMEIKARGGIFNEQGKETRNISGTERAVRKGSSRQDRQSQGGSSFEEYGESNGSSRGSRPGSDPRDGYDSQPRGRGSFDEYGESDGYSPGYGSGPDLGPRSDSRYGTEYGAEASTSKSDFVEAEIREIKSQEVVEFLTKRQLDGDEESKKLLREVQAEQARLEDQKAEAGRVTSELRTRLLNAGVTVIEHEQLAAIEVERGRWARSDFDSASDQKLLGASHLLWTEVRDRRGVGQYHLSTRLIDMGNREIVVEAEGERTPPEPLTEAPAVDSPFVLMSGQPVLIEFAPDVRPRTRLPLVEYQGGLPLQLGLPRVELVPMTDDDRRQESERLRLITIFGQVAAGQTRPSTARRGLVGRPARRPIPVHLAKHMEEMPPIPEGLHTRIGFLDDLSAPAPEQSRYQAVLHADLTDPSARAALGLRELPYRDLFGEEIQELPLEKIARIVPMGAESDSIPGAHRMRYATFRIAAAVLPQAGRVAQNEGSLLTVSLGHRNGLRDSDRLHVRRAGQRDRLEVELGVREILDEEARVSYNPDEYLFPERYDPTIGDIVYRRPDRNVTVGFDSPIGEGDSRELAAQIVDKLRPALTKLNVPVVDNTSALYLVQVSVDPPTKLAVGSPARPTKYPVYPMNIEVIDQSNKKVVFSIKMTVEEPEALSWDY